MQPIARLVSWGEPSQSRQHQGIAQRHHNSASLPRKEEKEKRRARAPIAFDKKQETCVTQRRVAQARVPCARGLRANTGEKKMTYQDTYQQSSWQNPMQGSGYSSHIPGMNFGLGQAAYGLQSGPYGTGQFGGAWGQRQLSPQDIGEVVRQMVPLLPQILAQSQQPMAAFG